MTAQSRRLGTEGKFASNTDQKAIRRRLLDMATRVLPEQHATQQCLHAIPGQFVELTRSEGKVDAVGLRLCNSAWTCAVCAGRHTENDRATLIHAMKTWRAAGGRCHLLTLTVPHSRHDDVAELVGKLNDARRRFRSGRAAKVLKRWAPHSVTALEVTHGDANGWHPHLHMVLFVDPDEQAQMFADESVRCHKGNGRYIGEVLDDDDSFTWVHDFLQSKWFDAAEAAGLPRPLSGPGFNLQNEERANAYVTKWGLAEELSKAYVKHAHGPRRTPWDILRSLEADSRTGAWSSRDAWLFRQFAEAFRGKSRLQWSRGALAELLWSEDMKGEPRTLDVYEIGDDQGDDDEDENSVVAVIDWKVWNRLARLRLRWLFLLVCSAMPGRELEACARVERAKAGELEPLLVHMLRDAARGSPQQTQHTERL